MRKEQAIESLRQRLGRLQRVRLEDKAIELREGLASSGLFHLFFVVAVVFGLPDFDDHPPLEDTTGAMLVVFESSIISDTVSQVSGEEEVAEPVSETNTPPSPTPLPTALPEEPAPVQSTDLMQPAARPAQSKTSEAVEPTQTQDEISPEPAEMQMPDFDTLTATSFSQAITSEAPVLPTEPATSLATQVPPLPPATAVELPQPAVVAQPVVEAITASESQDLAASITEAELTASAADEGSTSESAATSDTAAPQPAAVSAAPSARLTADEIAALKSQLRRHWTLPEGSASLAGMSVKVRIVMNADRTPREVTVVDLGWYDIDSNYRRLADSAVRAVWEAGRNKLILPPEKFDQWAIITVTFDLNESLNAPDESYIASSSGSGAGASVTNNAPPPPAPSAVLPAPAPPPPAPPPAVSPAPQETAPAGDVKLTSAEVKTFQAQLLRLWMVPSEFKNSKMKVQVEIAMNPDGSVKHATIVDQARYQSDGIFRVLADSVLSAIQAANREGFALPSEKYAAWAEIKIAFDPKWKN